MASFEWISGEMWLSEILGSSLEIGTDKRFQEDG